MKNFKQLRYNSKMYILFCMANFLNLLSALILVFFYLILAFSLNIIRLSFLFDLSIKFDMLADKIIFKYIVENKEMLK